MNLSAADIKHLVEAYAVPLAVNFVIAVLVLVIGRWIAKAVVKMMARVLEKKVEPSLARFLADVTYAILLMVVVIAALDQLGVKTTAAVAVLGAAGLAVGFALQGSLGNFAAGVMILLFKPFRVGDFVVAAGQSGTVESIKVFSTVLVTGDNRQIVVPNGQIFSGPIENTTVRGTRRIDLVFGIGYGDDIKQAKDILEGLIAADDRILREPAATVGVASLGASSVDLFCRPWTATGDYWGVHGDLLEKVKAEFDRAGISFPFPQQDVHVYQKRA
ncbi:MAG TPA: mechanosensitive ion channel domain-containing protein [Kofleriaceae bacterium]|nr:mechanosensitive ion channel domain-containing protein [Kofleriaceae bacterium]